MRTCFAILLVAWPLVAAAEDASGPARPVDFVRDVQPLLAKHCTVCHGVEEQQSELRLDAGALVLRGGDQGPGVIPGKSGESLLIKAVLGGGDMPRMPLDEEPLSAEEIALLKRWIDQGAKYPADEKIAPVARRTSKHWAFQPVRRPPLPAVRNLGWCRNAIDRFVLAKLDSKGLAPSPEADRATLARRAYLDLIGLPPTPQELDRHLADARPDAYERLVDELLASPRYGERWARHWLDVARYADSHGYTIDGPRSIWPYRDWVISAMNRDLPFDEFTIQQIAGDMLPGASLDQLVATGFHRNTLVNQEGGTDQEQFRVEAVVDRISTTAGAYLGLTLGCARCHSHKYDPISHREFYQIFAIFNGADEPSVPVPSPEQAKRQQQITADLRAAEAKLRQYEAGMEERRRAIEDRLAKLPLEVKWYPLKPADFKSAGGATLKRQDDESILVSGRVPASDTYTVTFEVPVRGATALRLEALTDDSLPKRGPGLAANGNFVLTDFKVARRTLAEPDIHIPVKIVAATADHSQPKFPVEEAIDDDPERSGWAINVPGGSPNVNRAAVFVLEKPLAEDDTRITLNIVHGHTGRYNLGCFRISLTPAPAEVLALPDDVRAALALPPEKRTAEQRKALEVELQLHEPGRAPLQAEVNRIRKQLDELTKTIPTTLVMRERAQPRETFIHVRGDFLRHGARVQPDVFAVLPPFPANVNRPNRLDFARWLVDPANPLTARVTVNRLWQAYFGRGIVDTENDFGTQGDRPSHPELLDWLASEFSGSVQGSKFKVQSSNSNNEPARTLNLEPGTLNSQRDSHWSLKAMHRLIVTSATYRQSSAVTPQQLQADRYNKWLGRQSRLRLEAETIRDVALAAAGLLSPKIGGPSVFPPQPEGIYDFTQNQKNWKASAGADRYRRGMYTYLWRSSPDPFLMTFDAPSGNVTCTRRPRSNTPLQSLTMANDRAFVEIAQSLAAHVLRECPSPADEERLRLAFRLCLAREPDAWEASRLLTFFQKQRKAASPKPAEADAAAWTAVARVLLNLDEFITRE
jgi:hypothetical protein